jgi:multicomponent Na+:H+ antiporter subunit C
MNVIDMTPSVVLVLAIGVLFAAGVYLLLERSLTRVLLGFILMGNGANLLFLVAGGRAGGAPLIGTTPEDEMSDPLVQAMVLTAIVITLGITAFVLAMAYRSWQLHGHDEVQDDLEDRRVARHAARNAPAFADLDTEESGASLDDEAAEVRDETDGDGDGITDGQEPPSRPGGRHHGPDEQHRPDDARGTP